MKILREIGAWILSIVGFVWQLPAFVLFWIFYIIPLIVFRQIVFDQMVRPLVFLFYLNPEADSWWIRKWGANKTLPDGTIVRTGWIGFGAHSAVIMRNWYHSEAKLRHEVCHAGLQGFLFGVFFGPFYGISIIWLRIFGRRVRSWYAAYKACPFEVWARRAEKKSKNSDGTGVTKWRVVRRAAKAD